MQIDEENEMLKIPGYIIDLQEHNGRGEGNMMAWNH